MQIEQGNFEVQMADKKRETDKKSREDAAKRAKEYADRELKAQIELTRLSLENSKERYKKESENQKLSLDKRLEALRNYGLASKALIDFQEKTETKAAKTPKEVELAKQKAIIATSKMAQELSDETAAIVAGNYEKETAALKKNYDEFVRIQEQKKKFIEDQIDLDANKKVIAVQDEFQPKINNAKGEERIRLEKELQDKITEIDREAELTRSEFAIANLESQMQAMKVLGFNTTSIEKLITDEKRKQAAIRKGISDAEYQDWVDKDEKKKERIDKIKEYETAANDFIVSLNSSIVEREKQKIQEQISLIEEKSQREIAAINASGLAQSEKEKRVMAIEKQSAFQKEQLEKRQRQLDMERARFEKAAAISQIVIQTVLEVIKAGGLLTPKGIEIAAYGAVALALAIAQPIPQFKKGTQNAPKGPALVSEEGPELLINKQGQAFLTPAKPSLIDLAGGEKIFTADRTLDMLNHFNLLNILQKAQSSAKPVKIDYGYNEKIYRELRALNGKPPVIIKNSQGIESQAWFDKHFKN